MFKNISLQAKSSLLQLGQLPIKPQCQELQKLNQTRNFLTHELPIRYIHLIKLLSVNHLGGVLSRVLEDVDLLQSTTVLDKKTVATLSKRLQDTLEMVNAMTLDKRLKSQIYTLELSVKLLLEEWEAIERGKVLVQTLDFVKVAEEAATIARQETQKISILSATGNPINTHYIKSHLVFMLSELIKSQAHQKHLNIVISEGKEDVCCRITNDEVITCASKPVVSIHGLGLRNHIPTNTNFVQSMARYWGGDLEKVQMGVHSSIYLHLKKDGGREHIPPVLETVPHNWIGQLLK